MVAHPWILKMGKQVSNNLKHSLSLPLPNHLHPHQSSSSTKRKTTTTTTPHNIKKQTIGILSFEVANVMSKVVHLHKSISDQEITKLKTEIIKSDGVRLLISPDETYLLELAYSEKLDDLNRVADVVSRLGKRCTEPALQGFEHVFADLVGGVIDVKELGFLVKDMEGMVKKMERYVSATANLYGELEVLNELEQASKKFQQNQLEESRRAVEQKLSWQKQDVRQLQDVSLWNQTYDKIVELLARTICTIYARIRVAFDGNTHVRSGGLRRNCSGMSAMSGSFLSFGRDGPISPSPEREVVTVDKNLGKNGFQSGPLPRVEKKSPSFKPRAGMKPSDMELFHGPDYSLPCAPSPGSFFLECLSLSNLASKVDDDNDDDDVYYNDRNSQLQAYVGNQSKSAIKQASPVIHSPCLSESRISFPYTSNRKQQLDCSTSGSLFGSNSRLALHATPSTIGGSALALHYANVIIVIEKLLRYPHLVGEEARDDLYQMLPTSLRKLLKLKLKTYFKNVAIYDASMAHDWKEKLDQILKWLAPLAHNMIRWQSERNFEQQQIVKRTNVLLLQTLYFADREKTESAVCQLLLGLNYICRYEHQQNALLDCGSFDFGDWMEWQLQCQASSCLN